jgi:hypothetical protein
VIDALPAEAERPRAAAYRLRPEPRAKRPDPGRAQPPVYRRFRFGFAKAGDARYLSHRQVMDALARALRAAGVPARYTEGYNPHIRVSMGPALAVGRRTRRAFDVDCAPVRPAISKPEPVAAGGLRSSGPTLLPQAPSLKPWPQPLAGRRAGNRWPAALRARRQSGRGRAAVGAAA